jgi:hypothetical protein
MTVRVNRRVIGLAMLALVGGVSLAAQQEVTLRYVWPKGETLRYKATQQTTATISGAPGAPTDVTLDQLLVQMLRNVPKEVAADGTATVEQTIESVQMDMNTPMGNMGFNSAKPNPSPGNPVEEMMGKIFSGMVNEPFTITFSPAGVVQKVEGVTKIAEKMFAALPPNPQADQMLGGLRASLSDEGMVATLSQAMPQLPTKPVKVGETWKGTFSVPNPALGKMVFTFESTLQSLENQIAKIQTKLAIAQEGTGPAAGPMGLKLTLAPASGDVELLFDVAKGRTQKAVTRFAMPITMSGAAPDGTALNIKNNSKTTLTLELIQ